MKIYKKLQNVKNEYFFHKQTKKKHESKPTKQK